MKVIVGSTNPVKINAVKRAFENYFYELEIQGCKTESGVSKQPLSADESYQGAYNRAKACLRVKNCDFGVGIEGGIEEFTFGTTTCGFVVILGKNREEGIGMSARMLLPSRFVAELKKGKKELGELMDEVTGENNIKQKGGMFGVLSKGVVDREDAYFQAVVFALSKIVSKEFYS